MSVEVKKTQHKYIIGPKGNSINEILSDTGVFVEMPSSDSTSETITLRGPQEKLGLGERLDKRKNQILFPSTLYKNDNKVCLIPGLVPQ